MEVVVVPARFPGDLASAVCTQTDLRAIQPSPLLAVMHVMQHAYLMQLLAIQLIGRIEGVVAPLDLYVPADGRVRQAD